MMLAWCFLGVLGVASWCWPVWVTPSAITSEGVVVRPDQVSLGCWSRRCPGMRSGPQPHGESAGEVHRNDHGVDHEVEHRVRAEQVV